LLSFFLDKTLFILIKKKCAVIQREPKDDRSASEEIRFFFLFDLSIKIKNKLKISFKKERLPIGLVKLTIVKR
jgi:hypothetical protein